MTHLHQSILATLSAGPVPFWTLRRLHDSGAAIRDALRELEGRVVRDEATELYHLVEPAPPPTYRSTLPLVAAVLDVIGPGQDEPEGWLRRERGASIPLTESTSPECPGEPAAETSHVAAAGSGACEHPALLRHPVVNGGGVLADADEVCVACCAIRFKGSDAFEHVTAETVPRPPNVVLSRASGGSLWTTPATPGAGGLPAAKVPGLEDDVRILTLDDVAEPADRARALTAHPTAADCHPICPCGAPVLFSQRNKGATICARCERREAGTMQPADHYHDLEDRLNVQARRLVALEELAIGTRVETLEGAVEHLERQVADIEARVRRIERPEPVGPVAQPLGIHVEALKERAAIVAFICKHADRNLEGREEQAVMEVAGWIERGEHVPVKP